MVNLLEVLRVQRHDFMNHLQVISGLLQLKKYDRAREYIDQVADELNRAAAVTRLGCPEIAAAILSGKLAAAKRGININHDVTSNLEQGLDAEMAVAGIVNEMLEMALGFSEQSGYIAGTIDLKVSEKDNRYVFQVGFRHRENCDSLAFSSGLSVMAETASRIKSRLTAGRLADGIFVITLLVPVPSALGSTLNQVE